MGKNRKHIDRDPTAAAAIGNLGKGPKRPACHEPLPIGKTCRRCGLTGRRPLGPPPPDGGDAA